MTKTTEILSEHRTPFEIYLHREDKDGTYEEFLECYVGCYKSEESFVQSLWHKNGNIQRIKSQFGLRAAHINWENVAIDYFASHYFAIKSDNDSKIYVFRHL